MTSESSRSTQSGRSPPSYSSRTSDLPPSYRSGGTQSSRNTTVPSDLSSTLSSVTSPTLTSGSGSEYGVRTKDTKSSSSSRTSSSRPTSASKHFHNHSHYHSDSYHHTVNVNPARSSNSAPPSSSIPKRRDDLDESTPLVPKLMYGGRSRCCNPMTFLIAFVISTVSLFWFLRSSSAALTFPPPSPPFWVNSTASSTCHSIGTREYTATLINAPKNWDPLSVCQSIPFVIHGKQVKSSPLECNRIQNPDGTVVAQSKWLVEFNESECYPVWSASTVREEQCVSPGSRKYFADLAYVPPGLDALSSCESTLKAFHGQNRLPNRCELVVHASSSDGSRTLFRERRGGGGTRLVARGEWIIDFDEPECVPTWDSPVPSTCSSYSHRTYHANLNVPLGLEPIALRLCHTTPLVVDNNDNGDADDSGNRDIHSVFPSSCESIYISGNSNEILIRGSWSLPDSDCIPQWTTPIVSEPCISYGTRTYHSDLVIPKGLESISLRLCKTVLPITIHSRSLLPTHCEALWDLPFTQTGSSSSMPIVRGHWVVDFDEPECVPKPGWVDVRGDDKCLAYDRKRFIGTLEGVPRELDPVKTCWEAPRMFFGEERKPEKCEMDEEHRKVVGTWFVGVPECRPVLKNLIDYGCIESESGYRRIEAEVVDIGKNEDWYRLCTTIPYTDYHGTKHFPVQCESRTSWAVTRRYALYNVPDSRCV